MSHVAAMLVQHLVREGRFGSLCPNPGGFMVISNFQDVLIMSSRKDYS